MLVTNRYQRGFSLVEILVCLFLGSLLLAMIIGLYVSNLGNTNESLIHSRLRTDLQALIGIMENDLRRAGYGGQAFLVGDDSDKVFAVTNTVDQQCVVYTYNFDHAESPDVQHFMGFRYSVKNKSIQFGRKVDKQVSNCFSSGYWVNLTDPNFLKIKQLNFLESEVANSQLTLRHLHIDIQVEWVKDSEYNHQISTLVQTRNPEWQ
ncbi:prepilin-type N-terminal cleavage/methylation domain-containing protein [Psychromonas sp. KJ10-2]|uniref:prepilin-type N-terminal cleavage/methylation domain-containing protein n=1 Tax=Psychromonas sp. KJ10-2 TaxID=3391822 RepID=UPI0039B55962